MDNKSFSVSKKYDTIQKTLRLPVPLAEKIEEAATKNNISFNCLVIQCIEYAFENLEDESKAGKNE